MTPKSGAQPRWSEPDSASKYVVTGVASSAPVATGTRLRPERPEGAGSASASSTVGRRSTWRAAALTFRGRKIRGWKSTSGTRSVASYAKMPCVASPCSPSASPWSEVSTTSVRPERPAASSGSRSGASSASVSATSPR